MFPARIILILQENESTSDEKRVNRVKSSVLIKKKATWARSLDYFRC